jgi:hypothetical protein
MKKIIIFGANSSISKNFAKDINVKKKFQILGIARQKTSKLKHFKKILKWDVLNENISDQVNKEIKLFNPDIIIFSQGANLNDNIYKYTEYTKFKYNICIVNDKLYFEYNNKLTHIKYIDDNYMYINNFDKI